MTQLTDTLPQESENQKIGRLAVKAFEANTPDAWMTTRLDGDNDFGYDFQIQVVRDSCVQDIFRAQLKGMANPECNADGLHFSVVLSLSTVNYYANAADPCLLVLCDVGSAARAKDCILYYSWIQDELARIRLAGVEPDQKSVTVHVPVAQVFNEHTDLSADIARFRHLAQIGGDFEGLLSESGVLPVARASAIGRLVPNLARRSAALVTALLDDDSATSWVEAPAESLPWIFQKADVALKGGRRENCRSWLDDARAKLTNAKPSELADYWHLEGRLHALLSETDSARFAFAKALEIDPGHDKYLESWAEAELQARWLDAECPNFSDVLARLTLDRPAIQSLRARLIAAQGDLVEAARLAEGIVGPEGDLTRAMVLSMRWQWAEAIDICTSALAEVRLGEDQRKALLLTLRARGYFFMALHLNDEAQENVHVPVTGPSRMDAVALRHAWEDIKVVVSILRARGWPSHVEGVADLWANTAIMLGVQKSVLPLMEEASAVQPTLQGLQAATELVALQSADFAAALVANARLKDSDNAHLKRVVLLHLADRHRECVALMSSLRDAFSSDPMDRVRALSSAIVSADRLVRPDLVEAWKADLGTIPEAKPVLALDRYREAVSANALVRDRALDDLLADFERLDFPGVIARFLLHELDQATVAHAGTTLEIAERLQSQQQLDVNETFAVAQAHVTCRQWGALLQFADDALHRYPEQERLVAISALALDQVGRTSEARERLQGLINKANPDSLAIQTYIQIATVSGFTEEAVVCLEGVLATATTPAGQFRCLRHLYGLIQAGDPGSPRLMNLAWRMGERADPHDEHQEAAFLMAVLGAPGIGAAPPSEERILQFQQRMDAFAERFPRSKLLRRYTLPEPDSGISVLRAIEAVIGVDPAEMRGRLRLQNQLARGAQPVPYAWRPRFVLPHVPDVPTMFEMAKKAPGRSMELQLIMAMDNWKATELSAIEGRVPLLDLTALVVVHDLQLFDTLFELFPTIAVGKATLIELQRLMSPMSLSPRHETCRSIVDALKAHFAHVEQPTVPAPDDDGFEKARWASQEVVALVRNNPRYVCYSDDAIFRIYATEGDANQPALCTLDLLVAADEQGVLKSPQVAQRLSELCRWQVGVVVPSRYPEAVLPIALSKAANLRHADALLEADAPSIALLGGLWHHSQALTVLQGHAGVFLRQLMETEPPSLVRVSAVMTYWAKRVRLHPDAPSSAAGLYALPIGEAAAADPLWDNKKARPLWNVYHQLIEHHFGNAMDEAHYDESIMALAATAARSDMAYSLTGARSIVARLRAGLTDGTSDADKFDRAVTQATLEIAARLARGVEA